MPSTKLKLPALSSLWLAIRWRPYTSVLAVQICPLGKCTWNLSSIHKAVRASCKPAQEKSLQKQRMHLDFVMFRAKVTADRDYEILRYCEILWDTMTFLPASRTCGHHDVPWCHGKILANHNVVTITLATESKWQKGFIVPSAFLLCRNSKWSIYTYLSNSVHIYT